MKKLFFNPFSHYSELTLMIAGLLGAAIGGTLAYCFNARYDGVLDLHFVENISVYEPFLDIAIAVFSAWALLFLLGKYINRKTRAIDVLSAVMISRIPFYLLPFFNAGNILNRITGEIMKMTNPANLDIAVSDMLLISVFGIASLLFLVWFFILLFNGFKTATNAKGPSHTALFIIAVLLAEILSKSILYNI